MCKIHQLVLSQIDDDWGGKYRQEQVQIAGTSHLPSEAWLMPQAMDAWSAWLTKNIHLHPIDLAAEAHHPTPLPDSEIWLPLREAAQGTPYSQEYLSLLARLGRIEAMKRGKT